MSRVEDAESIENDNEDQINESRREMFEELRARKETLESNLQSKIAELKAICIREAVSLTLHLYLHFFVIASSFILTVGHFFVSHFSSLTDFLSFFIFNCVIDIVLSLLVLFFRVCAVRLIAHLKCLTYI